MKLKKFIKRLFKTFTILVVVDLFYLNIMAPVGVPIHQIFLIAADVVVISNEKRINFSQISPEQWDQIVELAIQFVKETFKSSGFLFIQCLDFWLLTQESNK